jgi:hypothetical protein
MNNKPLLLALLAALLVLRFIVVPVFEWQNQVISDTKAQQNKLDKSDAYINDLPTLVAFKDKLTAALAARHAASDTYNDIGRYQIDKLRQLEKMFKLADISISSSNWLDPVVTAKGVTLQLNLQFSGKLKPFINLHTQIAGMSSNVIITDLNITVFGQGADTLGTFNGNTLLRFMPLESPDAVN